MQVYKSHGKLLLTGEYVVLDGAKSLALPTKFGQDLSVIENETDFVYWESYDENGKLWFKASLKIKNLEVIVLNASDKNTVERLSQILSSALQLNSTFIHENKGYHIQTRLDFNRQWGLGTSSTLINNISIWADINAYELLAMTFGGSGYDIACANQNAPITFQLNSKNQPLIEPVCFNPSFKDSLYFIYLDRKQNSREGIQEYRKNKLIKHNVFSEINEITESMIISKTLLEFEDLVYKHEAIISKIIKQEPIKQVFPDFWGSVKSLGAWGGDFILATSTSDPSSYFKSKGLETIIRFDNMVLN